MSAMVEGMLSPVEHELVRAFRTTDARGKRCIVAIAEREAQDWPAQRPKLTLVPNCGIETTAKREGVNNIV